MTPKWTHQRCHLHAKFAQQNINLATFFCDNCTRFAASCRKLADASEAPKSLRTFLATPMDFSIPQNESKTDWPTSADLASYDCSALKSTSQNAFGRNNRHAPKAGTPSCSARMTRARRDTRQHAKTPGLRRLRPPTCQTQINQKGAGQKRGEKRGPVRLTRWDKRT